MKKGRACCEMDSQRDFVRLRMMACLSERFGWLGGGVIFSHRRKKEREGCLFTYMTIYQNYIPVYCFAIMSANRCCINPNDSILSMLQVQPVKIVVNSG